MMRYTVTWHRDAENELLRIWMDSVDRNAVAAAANAMDRELATDPDAKGEEFYGDRLLVLPPLAVGFVVKSADLVVEVRQVWRVPVGTA